MEKMNAGYTILKEELTDDRGGICFGRKPSKYTEDGYEYVTWMFNKDGDKYDYFWGHYLIGRLRALQDYHERLASEYARMEG